MTVIRKTYVPLNDQERLALVQLAERERRDPRAQAAVLIRQALEKLGLLSSPVPTVPPQIEVNQNATANQ